MGTMIPSPGDTDVIQTLDNMFSGDHLENLRKFIGGGHPQGHDPAFLAHGRKLHRISFRMRIWPNGLERRWYYFLKKMLDHPVTAAQIVAGGGRSTSAEVIREALQAFVSDPNCSRIGFGVAPDDGTLNGVNYRADITPDYTNRPTVPYEAYVNLICGIEIPAGVHEGQPSGDGGERQPAQPDL